ncbi:MAG: DUF4013 domain-containing protein [Methanobrevibacter thaueri]|nr:DUF4013 domain-containing protein [Methanobrevibacter thaueri]
MNVGDIMSDALVYPFNNIKALVIFIILGIIAAIIGGSALFALMGSVSTQGGFNFALGGVSLAGFIVFILLLFLIEGYALDIIKFGIEKRADGPGIDFGRQIGNAIKLIIVNIVYYIVPSIIVFILGIFLRDWILTIISLILFLVFALAHFMAKCRLAKSDSLGESLAIGEAIGDISRVGLGKLLATVIVIIIMAALILFIVGIISNFNNIIGSILLGIVVVYIIFFYNRAIGLLYSEI